MLIMKYAIDKQEYYTILKVDESKLNAVVAPELKTELVILNNEGVNNIIVDMSVLDFVDSSGLSAILVGNRLCENAGGKLILAEITDNVRRLIKISQLEKVLTIIPTVQESRDFVMMHQLEKEIKKEA